MARGVDTPCWEWQGHLHDNGYGRLTNRRNTGYAHRFMWEAFNGPISDGFDVCHHCDNRKCVNPDHLFLGSRKDNMKDAQIKGRLQRGQDRHNSVLTPDIVRRARKLKGDGMKTKDIAARYGIKPQTMGKAINRHTWRHIA